MDPRSSGEKLQDILCNAAIGIDGSVEKGETVWRVFRNGRTAMKFCIPGEAGAFAKMILLRFFRGRELLPKSQLPYFSVRQIIL